MVGETGVEPAQVLPHNDLNVARIPFRHSPPLVPEEGLEPSPRVKRDSLLKTACLPISPLWRVDKISHCLPTRIIGP